MNNNIFVKQLLLWSKGSCPEIRKAFHDSAFHLFKIFFIICYKCYFKGKILTFCSLSLNLFSSTYSQNSGWCGCKLKSAFRALHLIRICRLCYIIQLLRRCATAKCTIYLQVYSLESRLANTLQRQLLQLGSLIVKKYRKYQENEWLS